MTASGGLRIGELGGVTYPVAGCSRCINDGDVVLRSVSEAVFAPESNLAGPA